MGGAGDIGRIAAVADDGDLVEGGVTGCIVDAIGGINRRW